jgi:uncharacterized MAPEG superfamily protein
MTLAYWCVLIAAILPIAAAAIAKAGTFGKRRSEGGFDNHEPRAWLERQEGYRRRANHAQANSFEALPFFIGAVIIAHQMGAAQARVDLLAIAFVLLRIAYIALYVADKPMARTVVWTVAFGVNIALLFAGA